MFPFEVETLLMGGNPVEGKVQNYFNKDIVLVVLSGRVGYGVGLRALACWERGFEYHRGNGCLSVVSVVCCRRSLCRADHSSRGVLPSVVCLSVIADSDNRLQLEGSDPGR